MNLSRLTADLRRHEGIRLKPYRCSANKVTIGIGRNLDDVGISGNEAEMMLANDIRRAWELTNKRFPVIMLLNDIRQEVLINMALNLGIARLAGFVKMWAAIENRDFNLASQEMRNSLWAKQVGDRATELAQRMKRGAPWLQR